MAEWDRYRALSICSLNILLLLVPKGENRLARGVRDDYFPCINLPLII